MLLSGKQFGQWLSINLGWGFGIIFGCYVAMGISGAHMNPAVTLAMGKLPLYVYFLIITACVHILKSCQVTQQTYLMFCKSNNCLCPSCSARMNVHRL